MWEVEGRICQKCHLTAAEFKRCPKREGNKNQRSHFMVTFVPRGSKIVLTGLLNEFLRSRAVRRLYEGLTAGKQRNSNIIKPNTSD